MASRERYGAGNIEVVSYDPRWPAMFEEEAARLRDALGSWMIALEHVGSTSVPGLAAKPIIDLLVGVSNLADARAHCVGPLESIGYRHMREYEVWLPLELLFRKGPPGPWTHHVHVTEPHSARWEELVLVRDFLRRHEDVAREYGALKRSLAATFGDDITGYRDAKAAFLQAVLRQASDRAP